MAPLHVLHSAADGAGNSLKLPRNLVLCTGVLKARSVLSAVTVVYGLLRGTVGTVAGFATGQIDGRRLAATGATNSLVHPVKSFLLWRVLLPIERH